MPLKPLETYLRNVGDIHRSGAGVDETSYYPYLRDLFDDVGRSLSPPIQCLTTLRDLGGGIPDGGFFTAQQLHGRDQTGWDGSGPTPERGALEAKPPHDDLIATADSPQVRSYLQTYGLVLVTNLRDFVLVQRDNRGEPRMLERFVLAESEAAFWTLTTHPRRAADQMNERLVEYLQRVMLTKAGLASPKQVAWFLASYARDARARIEHSNLEALTAVRTALESSLGLTFQGPKGDHFFRSTLIQTLFYGLFSAWVLWCHTHEDGQEFDWRNAQWSLHVPMIRALYEQLSQPSSLEPLHLVEPLEWAAGVLNRVDREQFFHTFNERQTVQYFYEPFLQEFDPRLRKDLGVWYTPQEIVQYQVARVDEALRTELGIPLGLADSRVVVLDPCCGTGTYLVETLRVIADTLLRQEGSNALLGQEVKRAAMTRIRGFEIMPAPFVVAHLQLSLLLTSIGAPLQGNERVGVYLTNSLTGWALDTVGAHEPTPQHLPFLEMAEERDAASSIKRDEEILVVIGNPPYNAFAGVHAEEEGNLVDCYKEGLNTPIQDGGWGLTKFNLDDLYVRFFRIAERRITEGQPGRGIVSYISNYSYLARDQFSAMRDHLFHEFDALWFDNMNGDSRATGKKTPDGLPDPSVFSTQYHGVGIKVGTAIATLVRTSPRREVSTSCYRDFWGVSKRQQLVESLSDTGSLHPYAVSSPSRGNRYLFRPHRDNPTYDAWPKLIDLAESGPITGFKENRGFSLIDSDRARLERLMTAYYDPSVSWERLQEFGSGLTNDAARFNAGTARSRALARERYDSTRIHRYQLRPFETQYCYYTQVRPIWNEPRPSLYRHLVAGNWCLVSRPSNTVSPEGVPFYATRVMGDFDFIHGHSYHFPCLLADVAGTPEDSQTDGSLFEGNRAATPRLRLNLSADACRYLSSLGTTNVNGSLGAAETVWLHVLAIGYSPAYLTENADGIRDSWPRIPMPAVCGRLESSALLGRRIAALLDTESAVEGATSGIIGPQLRSLGGLQVVPEHALDLTGGDLGIRARWGHLGQDGAVMPGTGRVTERDYTREERSAIAAGAADGGLTLDEALHQLGSRTYDVWLNDVAFWRNVPINVWNYVIGGYQVIKKWLSYRECTVLGRDLTMSEVHYVTEMIRRLAVLILLQPSLDANYRACAAAATLSWSSPDQTDTTGDGV